MLDTGARPIALAATDLSKRYGRRRWALRDVSVQIPAGELTALVGPNGAGKSTLIRTWLGFERPTLGRTHVGGHDPWSEVRQALAQIAYVPQSTHVYRRLTIADQIQLIARIRPGFRQDLAQARLHDLEIPLSSEGRKLSGGQQAQVALAIALATTADILLLDEPLAHLDPLARREFLRVVQTAVAADGRTALLSSHVVTDVEQTCTSVLLIGSGKVLLHSTIAEALARHSVTTQLEADMAAIAPFTGPDGGTVQLVKTPAGSSAASRHASLEEVVLGYLAAARSEG